MKVYIASDHGGFEVKTDILRDGSKLSYLEFIDLGPAELDPNDDYPVYAFKVAEQVAANADSLGILICRSGNGMTIAANKVKGIRAALCFTKQHATKAREDDHANVLVLDADYESERPLELIQAFVNAQPSEEERHVRRVNLISGYERG